MLGNKHFRDLVSSGALELVEKFEKERKQEKFKRKGGKPTRYGDEDEENEEDSRRRAREKGKERGSRYEDEDDGTQRKRKKNKTRDGEEEYNEVEEVAKNPDPGVKKGASNTGNAAEAVLGAPGAIGYHYGPAQAQDIQLSYRDRAAERRLGHNPDYDDDIAKLVQMDIEKSKYLGGDVKHTHLVRGLDYALLNKVRTETLERERQALEEAIKARKKDPGVAKRAKGANAGAPPPTQARPKVPGWEKEKEKEKGKEKKTNGLMDVRTNTAVGRGLQLFFSRQKAETSLQFKQISFEFDLDPLSKQELPTTVTRSLLDMAEEDDTLMTYALDPEFSLRVENSFAILHQGLKVGKRKKKKEAPKERFAPVEEKISRKPQPMDRMDDIFEDAGKDYIPVGALEPNHSTRHSGHGSSGNDKNYFSNLRAKRRDEDEEIVQAEAPVKSSRKHADESEKPKRIVHRDPLAKQHRGVAMNAHAEYDDIYPTTADFETYDSDEDLSKMDPGTTKHKKDLKPWDFENDEDWERHKSSREALPKAAFQFGVKMNDGRKTRRSSNKKMDGKNKLDYEMNQINKMLHKRN